jgi:maltose O-acetyltransferase
MGFVRSIYIALVSALAEAEFKHSSSGIYRFREWQLRLLNIQYVKRRVRIGEQVYFKNTGTITLGERCCIGSFSKFWNYGRIDIGDDFLSAGCLVINTGSHDPDTLQSYTKNVTIGHRVWCGVNVTILAGVTIGDDVVIGAGSVVTKDIPANTIAFGCPARPAKGLERDVTKLVQQFDWR